MVGHEKAVVRDKLRLHSQQLRKLTALRQDHADLDLTLEEGDHSETRTGDKATLSKIRFEPVHWATISRKTTAADKDWRRCKVRIAGRGTQESLIRVF